MMKSVLKNWLKVNNTFHESMQGGKGNLFLLIFALLDRTSRKFSSLRRTLLRAQA